MRRRALSSKIKTGPKIELQNYLTFEALADNFAVSLSANDIEYCIDGDGNWKTLAKATKTPYVGKGHLISVKANLSAGTTSAGIGTFSMTSDCAVSGNVLSLRFGDRIPDTSAIACQISNYFCKNMFKNAVQLIDAQNLILKAYRINKYGCNAMFQGCTNLVNPPKLPCTVFNGSDVYAFMFDGCTALEKAPDLPATSLPDSYRYMFRGCTNLKYIKAMFIEISSAAYLDEWVNGVSSSGTFVKNAAATWDVTGTDGVPSGWTVETATE